MKLLLKAKKIFMVFILFLIGLTVGTVIYVSADNYINQSFAPTPHYPKNENGETYGSALDSTSLETEPDLIKAYGEDGNIGYIRSEDLYGAQPRTPQEALEMQDKESGEKEIPLYDKEGKKIIGKFKIQGGNSTEYQK